MFDVFLSQLIIYRKVFHNFLYVFRKIFFENDFFRKLFICLEPGAQVSSVIISHRWSVSHVAFMVLR